MGRGQIKLDGEENREGANGVAESVTELETKTQAAEVPHQGLPGLVAALDGRSQASSFWRSTSCASAPAWRLRPLARLSTSLRTLASSRSERVRNLSMWFAREIWLLPLCLLAEVN